MLIAKIKLALAFLFGCIYSSSWWLLLTHTIPITGEAPSWVILPVFVITLSSLGILICTVITLADHWDDDKNPHNP